MALHPMGFAVPRRLRFERWSLTPPFHPYPALANRAVYSLWYFPSGCLAASPPACISAQDGVTRHRALRCSDFPPPTCVESDSPPFQNRHNNTPKTDGSNCGKHPSTKRPTSRETPINELQTSNAAVALGFGAWLFSGAWMLDAWSFNPPRPNPCLASNKESVRS